MQALPSGDAFSDAQAEMAADFGGGSLKRSFIRFDGKTGLYLESRGKKEEKLAPAKHFELIGVILFALPTQTLWPQVDDKTGTNPFALPATKQRVCQSKDAKRGIAFANQEEISADFMLGKRLSELGWSDSGSCAQCPLRVKDETVGSSACRPGYDVFMVLVDPRSKAPIDAESIAIVSAVGAIAFNGIRFGMRKIVSAKKSSIDSVVRLGEETFGKSKSPNLEVLGLASPELRDHCLQLSLIAWEDAKNQRNPFAKHDAPHQQSAPKQGPAQWARANDAQVIDADDIPF